MNISKPEAANLKPKDIISDCAEIQDHTYLCHLARQTAASQRDEWRPLFYSVITVRIQILLHLGYNTTPLVGLTEAIQGTCL